jgi:hypothetical protein
MGDTKLTFECKSYEIEGELTGNCDPFIYLKNGQTRAVSPQEM